MVTIVVKSKKILPWSQYEKMMNIKTIILKNNDIKSIREDNI